MIVVGVSTLFVICMFQNYWGIFVWNTLYWLQHNHVMEWIIGSLTKQRSIQSTSAIQTVVNPGNYEFEAH